MSCKKLYTLNECRINIASTAYEKQSKSLNPIRVNVCTFHHHSPSRPNQPINSTMSLSVLHQHFLLYTCKHTMSRGSSMLDRWSRSDGVHTHTPSHISSMCSVIRCNVDWFAFLACQDLVSLKLCRYKTLHRRNEKVSASCQ